MINIARVHKYITRPNENNIYKIGRIVGAGTTEVRFEKYILFKQQKYKSYIIYLIFMFSVRAGHFIFSTKNY